MPPHLPRVPQCLTFLSLLPFVFVSVGMTKADCGPHSYFSSGNPALWWPRPRKILKNLQATKANYRETLVSLTWIGSDWQWLIVFAHYVGCYVENDWPVLLYLFLQLFSEWTANENRARGNLPCKRPVARVVENRRTWMYKNALGLYRSPNLKWL